MTLHSLILHILKQCSAIRAVKLPDRHNVTRGSREYYDLELKYNQLAHRHRFDLVQEVSNLG